MSLEFPRSRVIVPILRKVAESYRESLTPRGRYLLWLTGALAMLGLNTRENQVFKVFAIAAAMLILAMASSLRRPIFFENPQS